jgi:predicted ribosomally synthesized peptide with SipW-like signal peptide
MNKKLVLSIGMLAFAGAAVIGGTGAFFTDTASSTGNVFTAGSVTLALTNIVHEGNNPNQVVGFSTTQNETGLSFAFNDLKPLDRGTVSFNLQNGANEAFVCARVIDKGGADNSVVDPELDLGDTAPAGELDQFLSFRFDGGVGTIASVDGQWTELVTSPVAPNTPTSASFDYCFGTFDGPNCVLGAGNNNLAQTDSLSADVEFYAVQTRNNLQFDCDDLNKPVVTEGGTEFASAGGVRYRAFAQTSQRELFLGKADLGTGNRAEQDLTWINPGTNTTIFTYDQLNDKLTAQVNGGTVLEYPNVSAAVTCPVGDWDRMQVLVREDSGSVDFNNVVVDGDALGNFVGTSGFPGALYTVTGIDFTDGMTMTGDVVLGGTIGASAEGTKVEVLIGCAV